MLNIGRLSPGAAEYYIGEIATSAEDYYTGRGESSGRWVGSLAESIGLAGEVDAADFRSVLSGQHPFTNEQLVVRPGGSDEARPDRSQLPLLHDEKYDLPRTASRLRMSVRRVRQLLWAGERQDGSPDRYLLGEKVDRGEGNGSGRAAWHVARSEVERYEAASARQRGRPGFDLTLRPPKSVSVLWALAPDEVRSEIRRAHAEAVDATVGYLERHALYARRWHDGHLEPIATDGVIAAAFDHRTSRAGDPLLHTHVVTANLTRTVDGHWQAIDARPIYDNARPAGILYQAHLRYVLSRRLGVEWEGVRNGWAEIKGVPKPVVREFSKRRAEIEELVAEAGYTSARAHQAATLASRQAKEYGVDADALIDRWRAEAAQLGFGEAELTACLHRAGIEATFDTEALYRHLGGPEGLTRHASSFTRKHVVAAVAEAAGARCTASQIELIADAFLASSQVQPVGPGAGPSEWVWRRAGAKERDIDLVRWSTPELIALERDLLAWADSGVEELDLPTPDRDVVGKVLARHPELSDEQVEMIEALSASRSAILPIAGRPGAGKTTATAVYVEALHESGIPTVGCSLAATAAAELERACDFHGKTGRDASTIARLLIELERIPLQRGTVVVLDEASMVGTRDLHRLAEHVRSAGGSIRLVGDPDQHGSVETGGAFRSIVGRTSDVIELRANNRQQDDGDRKAIEQFREGNVEAALARYDEAGRVVRSATATLSYETMVDEWWSHARAGARDPMIAGTNAVRRQLNQRARERFVQAGLVARNGLSTPAGLELASGDWVVARRNDRRLTSGDGHFVKNGDAGRVVDVDPERGAVTVAFDRTGTVRLPPWYVASHVEHGYARTTYGVQGATLDRAFVHVDDRTGFEEAYVAMTRGRIETRVYLVDGTAEAPDDETHHRAHDRSETGLDTVSTAMQRRRAGTMVHDADPLAAAVTNLGERSLAVLHEDRRQLESALARGPEDVTEPLRAAHEELDRLRVQKKARATTSRRPAAVVKEGEAIKRVTNRVNALRGRHRERGKFLDEHANEVERLRVVRRAELAREAEVRAAARTAAVSAGNPIVERALVDAAESVAVHLERHGRLDTEAVDPVEAALGRPPHTGMARMSYGRSAALLRAALELGEMTPDVVPDRSFEPTLFD